MDISEVDSSDDSEEAEETHEKSLVDMINPEHKMELKETVEYLRALIKCRDRLQDPRDDIESIFDKILKWKKTLGDLEEQETIVARKFRNTGATQVKIHNAKTILMKLKEEL